ncbi:MAG: aminotransferase class I/II-fold pyridoxal phosphate-dependent enzyme [Deltaproteobacteria bacterium]|nr:aminotransferase class I/II-fold pyridoxal phosphate-dependent enzyme [Deltaproteobacteria bacterium]
MTETRPRLTRRLAGFGTTIFTEMSRRATELGAINLAQGFPDFDGPEHVKSAAAAAIAAGHAQYAPMHGITPLHEALSESYARRYGLDYAPLREITVTSGATEAIFDSIAALTDVGDEVVLFEPYYDSYRASVCMAGAIPRTVTLRPPRFDFDPAELERAFGERTRVCVLNTPHNPTGKTFCREELEHVARLCIRHDVVCVADEVYEHLVYEGSHVPIATLPGMRERTVTISSLAKTFSLTGWKIGWALAPEDLTRAVRAAHQWVTFATATPLQHGAVAAVRSDESYFRALVASYRAKRDRLAGALADLGLEVYLPAGTYFVCAGFSRFGFDDDVAFCRHLIEKVGVAAIPPSAFFDDPADGRSFVRFAFCKRDETLEAAIARLQALRSHR